jgi:hypothetical protein
MLHMPLLAVASSSLFVNRDSELANSVTGTLSRSKSLSSNFKLRLPSMAAWHTFPQGFTILVFTFVIYLSIMAMLKCCNECPQKYEATSLRALKLHQVHCEAAQHQRTWSMQTRKTGLAKDRKQLASLHRCHKASSTDAADMEVRKFLPLFNKLN